MNHYQEWFKESLEKAGKYAEMAQHEASLTTLDSLRRLYRDLYRNDEFDYDKALLIIERLEELHMEAMENNYE